ncbi:hypothetical protein CYMTET_17758 [Cymbomonas tetramitiformis]|uniref:Glycosyltransferase 2-like domain-containing protein n=2 Tax=Cymbomonas tetramitiformis TaxID=36881 RepID=A0AAE0L6Y6_9CHLO|nr:hypothetical protein CYMTET_17758 [Cymbomonas tetramitiformis]
MVQNRKARSSKKRQIGESSTLVVVPGCYDEADRLPKQEFLDYASALEDIVFLFVNDGSKDGTLALLNSAQSSHPEKVQVLDLPLNRGKAEAAIVVGLVVMKLSSEENGHIEMVFGARVALLGRYIQRKASRHYLGRIFATLASLVLDVPIYDTQCGAKMFRVTPDLNTVLSQPFRSRWIFDVELIARFVALRKKSATLPQVSPGCRISLL